MWTSKRFSYANQFYEINNVPIVPKPYQRPHPRLWQAASASFEAGAALVLGNTLWEPLQRVRR
jgi:alkanesulfonate monooxygenase SsuD/methylene tetrahydromethanopterin reductase-like flavin-dependent oxidoreductase (luciferase family)